MTLDQLLEAMQAQQQEMETVDNGEDDCELNKEMKLSPNIKRYGFQENEGVNMLVYDTKHNPLKDLQV